MQPNDYILIITSLLGTGGLGAMLQYLVQQRTAKHDYTIKSNTARDQDERIFRRDLLKELDARESRHQQSMATMDARIATLQTSLDTVDMKYRALVMDYTALTERYTSQAQQIQKLTSITLERDHWQRQALLLQDHVGALEARISHLEAELEKLAKDNA